MTELLELVEVLLYSAGMVHVLYCIVNDQLGCAELTEGAKATWRPTSKSCSQMG